MNKTLEIAAKSLAPPEKCKWGSKEIPSQTEKKGATISKLPSI